MARSLYITTTLHLGFQHRVVKLLHRYDPYYSLHHIHLSHVLFTLEHISTLTVLV